MHEIVSTLNYISIYSTFPTPYFTDLFVLLFRLWKVPFLVKERKHTGKMDKMNGLLSRQQETSVDLKPSGGMSLDLVLVGQEEEK